MTDITTCYPNFYTAAQRMASGAAYIEAAKEYLAFCSLHSIECKELASTERYATFLHGELKLKASTIWTKMSQLGLFVK